MQIGEDDISRELRMKREHKEREVEREKVIAPYLSRIKDLEQENLSMKKELLWIIEDVWPLVHHLTSRFTLKVRFLELNNFMGKINEGKKKKRS